MAYSATFDTGCAVIKDVIDGLKLVADGIDSVKTIAEAVRSGRDYVTAKHPKVRADLRALLGELGKSMQLIKSASAVLTNFRFAVSVDTLGSDLVRFNDYFIKAKSDTQHLRDHIEDLRTHCSVVRDHGKRIGGAATETGFAKIFTMLGLNSPEREQELGKLLDRLAYEDFAVANSAERMLECLESALKDVQNALGPGAAMFPENVTAAAMLLSEYGPAFEAMEERAVAGIKEIRQLAAELQ
jgi:hypothetical protein